MSSWETPRRRGPPHAVPPSQLTLPTSPAPFLSATPTARLASTDDTRVAGYFTNPKPRPRPLHLIGLTPFGAFCRGCKIPVGSSRGQLRTHLSKHPELYYGGYSIDEFTLFAAKEVESLKSKNDPSGFLFGHPFSGISCNGCDKCFSRKDNALRHTKGKKNSNCTASDLVVNVITQTICGRLAPFVAMATPLPAGAATPYLTTADWLGKYVSGDEKVSQYTSIFHPFSSLGDCDRSMSGLVESWCDPPDESEAQLADLLQLAKVWLFERARYDTGCIPANYRAAIQVFEGQEVGEMAINFTYNFRHFESNLNPELAYLLSFAWRRSGVVASFKESYARFRASPFFVPQILYALFVEVCPNYFVQPTVVQFALSRSFRKSHDGLKMIKCDLAASQIAATVSLLRASVCGLLCSLSENADLAAPGIVKLVRSCRVSNILCPHIRHLKEMHARKGTSRMKTVSADGTVAVESFEFPKAVWSRLIPSIFGLCKLLIGKLIVDDKWVKVLDTTTRVSVQVLDYQKIKFVLNLQDGTAYGSGEVVVNQSADTLDYDRIVSYLGLAFFGCGGGATRGTEMEGLMLSQGRWHRNTLYYDTHSNKVYSSRAQTNATAVQHKLPALLARIFLLLRAITNNRGDDLDLKLLLPRRQGAKHSMSDAVAEIFNFSTLPSSTQVRQFFTGVSNVLFGLAPNWDGVLSASGEVAEMAGHSSATHRSAYSSSLVGGQETLFRIFHQELGSEIGCGGSKQLTSLELLNGLRALFGQVAEYTSSEQKEMVLVVANETSRHAHFGLPCGSGKSVAWLAPVVADFLAGNEIKTIVVVLPYKFLVDYHLKSANDKLGAFDISVLGFTGKDIRQSTILPEGLRSSVALPNLLFLSLEGLVNLLKFHTTTVKGWVADKAVRRFIIDEVHTIVGETFRSAYEFLPSLATYGVPIATMSGTLPSPMVPFVLRYLGLTTEENQEDIDILEVKDCLGSFPASFRFMVIERDRPLKLAVTAVRTISKEKPHHGVHVMVSGRKTGERLFNVWRNDMSCEFLTSETTDDEQKRIAKGWSEGTFKVLISSTIALVGNENAECRHVIIVGYLFSMMNVVQAIGRLRPGQREGGASVQIFIQTQTTAMLREVEENDNRCFESLRERKLIGDDRELHTRVGTTRGLYYWLSQDVGCRIKNLGVRYGFVRNECGFCDVCRGSPIRKLAARAQDVLDKDTATLNRAMLVLTQLTEKCLNCGKASCEGESCMGNDCYRCGGTHYSKNCREKLTAGKVLEGKACYDCYDLYGRRGYMNHNKENCPLKRRLRRMVHAKCKSTKQNFGSFMTTIYSEATSFYTFVASLSPRT
jgi:superfamily II DNA helicase RecQ